MFYLLGDYFMFPMKADLQELMITLGEIKHITGKNFNSLNMLRFLEPPKYWWYKHEKILIKEQNQFKIRLLIGLKKVSFLVNLL